MEREFLATGKTVEEAIEAAYEKAGVDREYVTVEIIERPKKKFFGLKTVPATAKAIIDEDYWNKMFGVKEKKAEAPKKKKETKEQKPKAEKPVQEQPKKQGKVIHWKRWIPVAAAACLVLVVSLMPFTSRGGNAAPEMANAEPASSSYLFDHSKAGAADGSHSYGVAADPAAPGAYTPAEAPESPSAEPADPAEPAHYWMGNQQVIRVHYGATPAPGAQIVGSVESLKEYLSGFDSLMWDGEGNTIPIAELEALTATYTEEYFRTHRLLCVVIESGSGSNRYEFAPQGLYRDSVTVLQHIPEVGTCDMAAWLLIAEVDTMFDDGDTLEVNFIR